MGKFEGKVVIITGASSGIGKSTAIAFAKEGANVAITGRNKKRLADVADECSKAGVEVLQLPGDLLEITSLESIISKTVEKFGAIDILVNNAGAGTTGPVEQLQLKDYESVMDLNLRAPIFLCKHALPHLRKTKGCIVNVSSVFGKISSPGIVTYCVSKAALDHFMRGFASECVVDGVRVNNVNPGIVETDFLRACLPEETALKVKAKLLESQPLGILQGDEIANSIMHLCEAKGMTGSTVVNDRGHLLQ